MARTNPLMAALSDSEILILGGCNYAADHSGNQDSGEIIKISSSNHSCERIKLNLGTLAFCSFSNQCMKTINGNIIGLVSDERPHMYVAEYLRTTKKIKILAVLGAF